MALYNLPNSTSMDQIIADTSQSVPSFVPMLLLFVYFIVLIGGFTSQKRKTGYGDLALWSLIAAIGTLFIALPFTMMLGIIQVETLAIIIILNLGSAVWFFLSRGRFEQ